jgi:ATP-dependent exoDNAse (exonuclease V) beta subunit
LVVGADAILLLDYKTGVAPSPGVVRADTARQLALYADLLARTFPGRPVIAHVLWTGVPRLDRVSEGALLAARESVMAAIP